MRTTESKSSHDGQQGNGLHHLFETELKDIYWAEKALTKAIPKMIKNATSQNLIKALEAHLATTLEQVTRVEEVFQLMGMKPQAKKCDGISGIVQEAESIMKESEKGTAR